MCLLLVDSSHVSVHFEYTIGRTNCHRFDYRKIRLNMADGNCLHFQIGRQSRGFFCVFCMRTARPRTLNRINNELMGKNYRFDYLHFYFANWITFPSGILDGTIKQSRTEQSKSNIVEQKSQSNRIKSLNCRIEPIETYSESKVPDERCVRKIETQICNHYNGNIVHRNNDDINCNSMVWTNWIILFCHSL